MIHELEKITKAKNVLFKIAKGIDPLSGETLSENGFFSDPRIIRCFYYVTEILDDVINEGPDMDSLKPKEFKISPEEKMRVVFPEGKIGVNEFSRQVNLWIDPARSKKLTGAELNKRLKKMGILSEKILESGKTKTVTNETSAKFGFEMEKRSFHGVEYDMVLINDGGKKYLLQNIDTIMDHKQIDTEI
ncbi:MAG TPA: hypothetical protein DDW50_23005 [Firmicutes bacterium]|jgi:hypothetical protein|nr:hypothetical protein [Bacillota bacterium]